ncbi:unnamed protein product [Closterium sp. NIES-65]|nr:unnamed protein product [Closterium sp. NIES-65]
MIGRSASMEEGRARLLTADAALTDAILTGVIMPTPTSSSLGFPQCAQHGSTATAHNGGGGGMVGSSVDCSHSISVVWRSGGAALTAAAASCAAETGQRGTQSTRSRVVCSLRLPAPRLAVPLCVCESRMPVVADRVVLRKLAQDMCEWSRLLVSEEKRGGEEERRGFGDER